MISDQSNGKLSPPAGVTAAQNASVAMLRLNARVLPSAITTVSAECGVCGMRESQSGTRGAIWNGGILERLALVGVMSEYQ